MLLSPMKVSTTSDGTEHLHSLSCNLFNHNHPQSNVHCLILNNLLQNPYKMSNLPRPSIDNDILVGGLARKLVSKLNKM